MGINQKKTIQLGMSYGKAGWILRKSIMFWLLEELGWDICCRCNTPIDTVDEVSIEHKEPWLDSDNPAELFFDLDNIGFSHVSCNRQHRTTKKIGPPGTQWCWACKQFKDTSVFPTRTSQHRWSDECRECHTIRKRKLRAKGRTAADRRRNIESAE